MSNKAYKIFKGAGVIFLGSMIGLGLRLISKVLIARSVSVSDFGIYSLASVVFSIAFVLALLGMEEGVPRQVAYFRKSGDVSNIISSSLIIATISGICVAGGIFLASDYIALIFHKEKLSLAIRFFSIALPFSVLMSTMLATFRGFEMPEVKALFGDSLKNGVFVLLLTIVYFKGFSLIGVLTAYDISVIVAFFCLAFMLVRRIDFEFSVDARSTLELLRFSIPLLLAIILGMVMAWTDTLMIGYFEKAKEVGLYSAAHSLASLLPIFLSSAGYMFIPVASRTLSEGSLDELKRIYQTTTKWIFSITVPFFAIFMLHPKFILSLFFGEGYAPAFDVLIVLALGFMFHVVMGLNGASLIVLGGGSLLMYMTMVGAISNVILNLILIPMFGIFGAAIATTISYTIANAIASVKLFNISGIHPFTKNYLKALGIAIIAIFLVSKIPSAILMFVVFVAIYFSLMFLLKCVDESDRELFSALKSKLI